MKSLWINLAGGLAGAAVLTLLQETIHQLDSDAPLINLAGEESVNKTLGDFGADPLSGEALTAATISSNLVANGLYYSSIGQAKTERLLFRGIMVGLAAGWGALTLTKKLNPGETPEPPGSRTPKTKVLTFGYYILGGITAGLTIRALRNKVSSAL